MNILDFLRLKHKFNKRDVMILLFAFLFAVIVSTIIVTSWFSIDKYISPSLKRVFEYDAILISGFLLLIFIGYILGLRMNEIELDSWILKTKYKNYFPQKIGDCEITNLFDFQGFVSSKYEDGNYLYLTTSSEGLITKKAFGNFILNFTARLTLHGFGVVLCARDLENYLMFRINADESGLYISPHIRKDGIWEVQNLKVESENKLKIDLGKDYKFEIRKNNHFVNLVIKKGKSEKDKSDEIIKEFFYIEPTRFPLLPSSDNDDTPKNIVSILNFPKFGKVGFRACWPEEQAIIKDLAIRKYEKN